MRDLCTIRIALKELLKKGNYTKRNIRSEGRATEMINIWANRIDFWFFNTWQLKVKNMTSDVVSMYKSFKVTVYKGRVKNFHIHKVSTV